MEIVRRIAVAATVMLTVLGGGLLSTGGPAAAVDPPGYPPAYIKNNESGYCMDDYMRTEIIYQYPCNPQRNQWWWWDRPAGKTGNIWMIHIVEGGIDRCLAARGNQYYTETYLSICRDGQSRQHWRWLSWGNDWRIQSVDSNHCLGAVVGITQVVLAECVVRPNILWKQVPVW